MTSSISESLSSNNVSAFGMASASRGTVCTVVDAATVVSERFAVAPSFVGSIASRD